MRRTGIDWRETRKIVHITRTVPITLKKLYWRDYFTCSGRPFETSAVEHGNWLRGKTGARFEGLAFRHKHEIVLDIGSAYKNNRESLFYDLREALVHEVCHRVFHTPYVKMLTKWALRSWRIRQAAERRIIRLLLPSKLR